MTRFLSKRSPGGIPISSLSWLLGLGSRAWLPQMLAVVTAVGSYWLRRADCACHFPTPCSVMAHWYLKIRYGGSIRPVVKLDASLTTILC